MDSDLTQVAWGKGLRFNHLSLEKGALILFPLSVVEGVAHIHRAWLTFQAHPTVLPQRSTTVSLPIGIRGGTRAGNGREQKSWYREKGRGERVS